ncbi:MAG: S9 family peptidase [Gemmatimonadetes bacterium]|nr:S9 family peptidase [Gemmatimonadota bacterium]
MAAAQTGYRQPPPEVVDILDAPQAPFVTVGPDRSTLVLAHRSSMPSIEEQSQPMLRLAGRRINPLTNGQFSPSVITGLSLMDVESGEERRVSLPEGGGWTVPVFSPNGERFAFQRATREGTELWVGSVEDGAAARVLGPELNGVFGRACDWMPRTDELLCRLVPGSRGAPPVEPAVPEGPIIQESEAKSSPVRTYQDLLGSPHDADLYDYYAAAEVALVHAVNGTKQVIGDASAYRSIEVSPSGSHILVERLRRPYSYLVPDRLFARDIEIWDTSGNVVRVLHEIALGDQIPIGGVYDGPRGHQWLDSAEDVVSFTQALDGGDPRADVPVRDRVIALAAPFDGEGDVLAETEHRFMGLVQGAEGLALVTEYDRPSRLLRTWKGDMNARPVTIEVLWERNSEDRYSDPGTPVREPVGGRLLQRDDWIYLSGAGASDEGDRPFLDRLNIRSGETERLFQSGPDSYETVVALLDDRGRRVLTSYESQTEPPNYYVRDLRGDGRTALTAFENPAAQLEGVSKEFVVYEREDGVQLSGTLYLPPGYEGQPLPTVVWAYPREYSNADMAGQVRGSPHRFPRISGASHLLFLTQGYAVFDGPTMPIVGGDVANDTYVEQLVSSAKAAVDKVVSMGVADPDRIGIGGHSYGAFMTANLLAHSDLFQAGIARSGAYNRTLTPFGFQSERRTFWEASDLYFEMSPFMHADQINEPMLMIHGEADNNSGTFPIQSDRMYHAMKGLGGKARLVVLPNESHGYRARESVFHALAEMIEWFDRYVKKVETQRVTMPEV